MGISFLEIPNNIRHPIFAVEFDSSNAMRGAGSQVYKSLIVGQKLAGGSASYLKPVRVSDKNDAINQFGAGSMLAEKADYYRRTDPVSELFAVAVPDDPAGVEATATVSVVGTASTPGALYMYISGNRFTVPVKTGDAVSTICSAIAEKVNGESVLPVTAIAASDKVTLRAKHPGEAGNDLDARLNYYDGEATPAGLDVHISEFSGGVANPDITDALSTVMGEWMNSFTMAYTDLNNMHVVNEYLKSCWGPLVMREGWSFTAKRGTFGELCAFGSARNSPHECVMHCRGIPNSPGAVAASVAANIMRYGNADQARPFQTLPMVGILAPAIEDRFSNFPENNNLLHNGISDFTVDESTVRLGRVISTYKKSANGADDTAYLDLNTSLTLGYLRWDLRNYFMRKYPRHKLASDGTHYDSGQAIMTPKLAKAECVNKFDDWVRKGLTENPRQFKAELKVQRNDSDPNRLDFLLPPDLMNQFIVGAVNIQFLL